MRPRLEAVEKLYAPMCVSWATRSFNAATAGGRGETVRAHVRELGHEELQCGHGWRPWRNPTGPCRRSWGHGAFNAATAGGRGETQKEREKRFRKVDLQCGHGWRPWRNHRACRAAEPPARSFNAATAGGRGETAPSRSCTHTGRRPSMRPRLEAVEKQPWRGFRCTECWHPSMRPRLEAVEKQRTFADEQAALAGLQCGHGWRPWRNRRAYRAAGRRFQSFNAATAGGRGETLCR